MVGYFTYQEPACGLASGRHGVEGGEDDENLWCHFGWIGGLEIEGSCNCVVKCTC